MERHVELWVELEGIPQDMQDPAPPCAGQELAEEADRRDQAGLLLLAAWDQISKAGQVHLQMEAAEEVEASGVVVADMRQAVVAVGRATTHQLELE